MVCSEQQKVVNFKEENVFYIRFHVLAKSLKEDFEEMLKLFNKNETKLSVRMSKSGDLYEVRPGTSYSSWEIVMHKYFAYSKQMRKGLNGERYSPVYFSLTNISLVGAPTPEMIAL